MTPKTILPCALSIALATPLAAYAQALEPGEYIAHGGAGHLTLKRGKDGNLAFAIHAVGGNAHVCNVDGSIRGGKATVESTVKGKPCIVTFTAKKDGVDVSISDHDLCSAGCGARASYDDMYFKPEPGCERGSVRKSRSTFKQQYDRKDYATARATLEPVLKGCAKTLSSNEEGWIRNDLALAQLRSGDAAECRRTLEPLAKDAAQSDAQIRDSYPPNEADSYMPVLRATRTNLKLCAAGAGKK